MERSMELKPVTIVHGRDGSPSHLIGGTAQQAAMLFNARVSQQSQSSSSSSSQHRPAVAGYSLLQSTLAATSDRPSARHETSKNVMKRNGRKACNCTRSACLKLYCDCFANGEFCDGCNCKDCFNNLDHDFERSKAIKQCLERNPNAFQPKIASSARGRPDGGDRVHLKGCHCKRSNCLKNYCECYEARVACSERCKCIGCCNVDSNRFDPSAGAAGATPFSSTAAARSQQLAAQRSAQFASSGLMSLAAAAADMDNASPGGSAADTAPPVFQPAQSGAMPAKATPWYYMNDEVVEATALCLMAQAEECERRAMETNAPLDHAAMEALMLREFGRCLQEIIANCESYTNPDEL